jgi:hypothetical protein
MRSLVAVLALAGCSGRALQRPSATLRTACSDRERWEKSACVPRGDAAAKLAAGKDALDDQQVELATAAIDAAARLAPLDHESHILLWEERGIVAAFTDDAPGSRAAFEMLLALDPGHFLSYLTSPKATQVFEVVRNEAKLRGAPALEVNWAPGQKVGAQVPVAVTVVADPKQFLSAATLFVRTRGESTWSAVDLALGRVGTEHNIVLPPITATRALSLELYLRAYDERGNEVLGWADPTRPREIPLRYDPPRPWWQTWWGITLIGSVAVAGTTSIVYAATRSPPDRIDGSVGTVTAR